MNHGFIPHTASEIDGMLSTIGVAHVDDLFEAIPDSLRASCVFSQLPEKGRNELDLQRLLNQFAQQNKAAAMDSFQGGGAYWRFIPPAVNALALRSEFYTAYTPYQPEVSQGTLQTIYEFQSMMAELTGLDVTNASVYDGATAVSESVMMAIRGGKRTVVGLSSTLNPQYIRVLETYVNALADEALPIRLFTFNPAEAIQPQLDAASIDPKTLAALVIQQPDYFGSVHDITTITSVAKSMGALTIVSVDPVTLALLEPPGKLGADIVCGDIQPFGNSLNYGGPYGGFIATTQKWTRQLPGRLVGRSVDKEGKTAYTLTLQTREQHIRREKATSNICTNQSLNVLKACIYLALMGPQGLKQVAMLSAQRAHFLANALIQVNGVSLKSSAPFLYEFALNLPIPAQVLIDEMGERHGIIPGIRLSKYWPEDTHGLLVTVTEMNSQETLIRYIDGFTAIIQSKQGLFESHDAQSTQTTRISESCRGWHGCVP